MKTVTIPVKVPASFFTKTARMAKRFGFDVRAQLGEVMAEITLHQLEDDYDLWLGTYTFPNRKAAQRAVNEKFKDDFRHLSKRSERVSYREGREVIWEEFWAPGAFQAAQRVDRLWTKAKGASGTQKERAYDALEKELGVPILRKSA